MKSTSTIVAITLFSLLPVAFVHGQGSQKPAASGAAAAGAGKRTDVYHVHFTKAALGKAVQLGDWLKTPDRSNPMPEHLSSFATKTAMRGITSSSRTLARKRLWKLQARLCLRTNATLARGTPIRLSTVRHGRNSAAPWALTPIRSRRRPARFILFPTIALLRVIDSNWRKCLAKRRVGSATRARGTY